MQLLLPAAYTAVFIYVIFKFSFFECEGLSKKIIALIFLLKIVCGTALWAIYTYYYTDRSTADIYKYFDDSNVILEAIKSNPIDYFKMLFGIQNDNAYFDENYYHKMNYWSKSGTAFIYNESHTIIRFNAFARLFSLGNYHVHTVFVCFLSLVGLCAIYKTFVDKLKNKTRELTAIVFFLPSILLWTSGVLKEGLLVFALGVVIYSMKLIIENKFNKIILFSFLILSLYLLLLTKFYAIAAIIPCLVSWLWCGFTGNKNAAIKFGVVITLFVIYLFGVDGINDYYSVPELLSKKQQEFIELAKKEEAKSFINTPILEASASSILKNTPIALFNAIFRPHPLEAKSPFILLAMIENLLITGFILLSLITNWFKKFNTTPEFYLAVIFSLLMLAVIGLTTPVLGAMVRYRCVSLIFLLIAFLFIYNKEKTLKIFPFLKKITPIETK